MFIPLSITFDSYFYCLSNQIPIICSLIRHPNSNGLPTYRIILYKEWQGTYFEFGSLACSVPLRLQALNFYNTDYWNLLGFHFCHPTQVPWQCFYQMQLFSKTSLFLLLQSTHRRKLGDRLQTCAKLEFSTQSNNYTTITA